MRSNLRNNFRWYKGGNQFIENDPDLTAAWNLGNGDSVIIPVTHPATALGRNLVVNPDFAADATWTKGTGWTIAGGVAVATAAAANANLSQAIPLVIGKLYEVIYTISGYVAGTVRVQVGSSGNGTARTADGTYTEQIVCAGSTTLLFNPTVTFTGNIDNVSVKQVNIPASILSLGTNLLVDGDMEAVDTAAYTAGNSATLSKQTGTPFQGVNILRIARNGVNNANASQAVLTAGKRYRVTGYVRGDGTAIPSIVVDGSPATPFTGTSSTNWQYFEFSFLATNTRIYLFNTVTSGTNYVEFDDVRVVEDLTIFPGNRLQDGDMEASGVTWWATNSTPTVTKETSNPFEGTQWIKVARNGGNNPEILQNVCIVGKTYRMRGRYRGDGTAQPRILNAGSALSTGTNSTDWQPFDFPFVATGINIRFIAITSTGTEFAGFDALVLEEISPMTGLVSGAIPGVASGVSEIKNATFFDASNDIINIYSTDFNSAFNPDKFEVAVLFRTSSGSVVDGINRRLAYIRVDDNNRIIIDKLNSTNIVRVVYIGSATQDLINVSSLGITTKWQLLTISVDKVADQLKCHWQGIPEGAIQTGIGAWAGNLLSTTTIIGGSSTTDSATAWGGLIGVVAVFNNVKSDAWHKELARRFGVA